MPQQITFLEFAFQVLSKTKAAMTPDEIWTSAPGEKLKPLIKTSRKDVMIRSIELI